MLYEESLWFKKIIQKYAQNGALVLNIGSSTKEFIEVTQPYIKTNLFDVFEKKNCIVKNVDIKQAAGIDYVGDVTNPIFVSELKSLNASFIVCSNLLEHLSERKAFCEALVNLMNKETKLIISVPYSFPYHEDPIDTLYRPSLLELQSAFPTLIQIEGKIVDCGSFLNFSNKNNSFFYKYFNFFKNSIAATAAFFIFKSKFEKLSWVFKRISATCVVYQLK
jgi:hypothetical protein